MRGCAILFLLLCVACSHDAQYGQVDKLNDEAYYFHYISLDSTFLYAKRALSNCGNYEAGRMEALNNLAFFHLAKMNYSEAEKDLSDILSTTNNQLELFVANVQMMRLCQRMSRNKEFYTYYWAAESNAKRIEESRDELINRQLQRYIYADTEMKIVYSAYLYYVGQIDTFRDILRSIDVDEEAKKDTSQLLNYLYNIGSGGYYQDGTAEEISQREFSNLLNCYFIALRSNQIYWQANALQAMSEHLLDKDVAPKLLSDNSFYIRAINDDEVVDSLIACNFAQRSLNLFMEYGDTYQIAGALRSLSDCYFQMGLYDDAIASLELSLTRDSLINQAPALTSSIFERLSIDYSALNNKPYSDYFRNLYLDTQENTRQDRELDVRAEQLNEMASGLNFILLVLLAVIVVLFGTLYTLVKRRNKGDNQETIKKLLEPLEKWKEQQALLAEVTAKEKEEISEQQEMANLSLEHNLQISVEQRAKVSLVNSITPLINRIILEISNIKNRTESQEIKDGRYTYISELNTQINKYNDVLTDWIQLRKGELSLKIESFALQELFDILAKGKVTFSMQDVRLNVEPTTAIVKADKALTLFMLNTIADNARKAVGQDGEVMVSANENPKYIEIAITDTGKGMDEEELRNLFVRQTIDKKQHGFGLMNCKGIIERLRRVSQIFSVCQITAESEKGKGSTFRIRLPHGILRTLIAIVYFYTSFSLNAQDLSALEKSKNYADSAYFCNLQGRYTDALDFAKKTYTLLNTYYKSVEPNGKDTLLYVGQDDIPELHWLSDSINIDYGTILDVRNETAIAALASHEWDVYSYNNKIYTRLFRELSTDHDLPAYVKNMQEASNSKNIAIVLLILLLMSILVAYYFLYYRHRVIYRSVVERINLINKALFEEVDDNIKLKEIRELWKRGGRFSLVDGDYKSLDEFNSVVEQIVNTLEANQSDKEKNAECLELAMDELNRIKYESESLHVSNNVLDNCLSALKHETMYYPSKMQQILEMPDKNIDSLDEVAQYYKALFSLLSMQAQTQVENVMRVDNKLKSYLRTLLLGLFEGDAPIISLEEVDDTYETFRFVYPNLSYTREQIDNLFMPLTINLKCLLVRQIVREIGESVSRRACGVKAMINEDGELQIDLTLPKEIKFEIVIME